MGLLPSFIEDEIETATETSDVLPLAVEYGIDYKTGELTGKTVEGIDAVKVWTWNCLKTERYRHPIYSWEYGAELDQYIGQALGDEYLQTDCQTEIEDALLVNPYIVGISDFSAEIVKDRLLIQFVLKTIYGETEVSLDV